MENSGFEGEAEKKSGVELVEVTSEKENNKTSNGHGCKPEVCRQLHEKYLQDKEKISADPWDRLKTIFLVLIISLFLVWLIVYITFSKLDYI